MATIIWLGILAAFVLTKAPRQTLKSLARVIRAALKWKLIGVTALSASYVALVVTCLRPLNAWTPALLKDTILWFIFSGLVTIGRAIIGDSKNENWQSLIADQFKAVVIVEYILNAETFSLGAELLIQPVLLVVIAVLTFSQDPQVLKVFNVFQAVFGIIIFAYSFVARIQSPNVESAVREIFLPLVLSATLLPWLYLVLTWTNYDALSGRLKYAFKEDKKTYRQAMFLLFQAYGFDPFSVRLLLRTRGLALLQARSIKDIQKLVS